ncbi:MAG: hypothetical protein LBT23_01985 [Synergistaceae bacterium]|jgi:hypothetical protein|nr:hypothetical protein [Synergistaceae bacterium]
MKKTLIIGILGVLLMALFVGVAFAAGHGDEGSMGCNSGFFGLSTVALAIGGYLFAGKR